MATIFYGLSGEGRGHATRARTIVEGLRKRHKVVVFAPDGTMIGSIPAPQAANVAFGGPEGRTLFITAGPSVLAVDLAIPGLPY